MDYNTFKNQFAGVPLILSKTIIRPQHSRGERQQLLNQLNRWRKRGLVLKVKKGMYVLNEHDRKINPSKPFLANQMYAPSYVSLEYALGLYGLIPERVPEVTSITSKKTVRISNPLGRFSYHHVMPAAFTGFRLTRDENNQGVLIANPEKAVVDFLYLRLARTSQRTPLSESMFAESYRFQDVAALREQRLLHFASLYNNSKLRSVVRMFCKFRSRELPRRLSRRRIRDADD
jgi:hypothetical protein